MLHKNDKVYQNKVINSLLAQGCINVVLSQIDFIEKGYCFFINIFSLWKMV